jgi:hypothetical protein
MFAVSMPRCAERFEASQQFIALHPDCCRDWHQLQMLEIRVDITRSSGDRPEAPLGSIDTTRFANDIVY